MGGASGHGSHYGARVFMVFAAVIRKCVGQTSECEHGGPVGMNYLFEGRKLGLYLITVGYHLISYLIAGLIIGVM